jgi:hypothetical protein
MRGRRFRSLARERIPMPEHLCFEENYEETAACLIEMQGRLRQGEEAYEAGKRETVLSSFFDFATIKSCSPSAALVIAAEYDKWRSLRGWDIPVINRNRWDRDLKALLKELGFFRLLDIPWRFRAKASSSVQTMQFQTGSLVARNEVADMTDSMKSRLVEAFPTLGADDELELTIMQLLGAIQEATENACDHAYRDTSVPVINRRWWATGAIDVGQRHMNLIVYDQGKTIPVTLPAWEKYPFIESRLARFKRLIGRALGEDQEDAIKMRLAMDAPRSSTDAAHRGKGFVLFRRVVEQSKAARLRILSRHGEFLYQKGRRPQGRALKTPLNGTLVEWDLWL